MLKNIINDKRWYLLVLTQEGAKKWTTVLSMKFPDDMLAIVTTRETISAEVSDIRKRDVAFHVYASRKEISAMIRPMLGDYIVALEPLANEG